jgi:hypothetical protein
VVGGEFGKCGGVWGVRAEMRKWRVASGEWRVGREEGFVTSRTAFGMTVVYFDAKSGEIWDFADMGRSSAAALRGNGGRFFWWVRLRFFVAESSG